jgi:hypothetical protein
MAPLLMLHIGAGSLAILSGALAATVRKGQRLHRRFGTLFFVSMLIMSTLGVYLALFGDHPGAGAAPPKASVAVGVLTFYLVTTAWVSARRRTQRVGAIDYAAVLVVSGALVALLIFGAQARISAPTRPGGFVPYFVFAGFAALLAGLDMRVILKGGVLGVARVSRHLWRMCFGLFFAAAFFFLGQQKVMPQALHGSPFLLALAFAPLLLMVFWLVRVRVTTKPLIEVTA